MAVSSVTSCGQSLMERSLPAGQCCCWLKLSPSAKNLKLSRGVFRLVYTIPLQNDFLKCHRFLKHKQNHIDAEISEASWTNNTKSVCSRHCARTVVLGGHTVTPGGA